MAVKCSVDVGIASVCCGSAPAAGPGYFPHVEPCGRPTGTGSHCHQLPAAAMRHWVPQTSQAFMACLLVVMGLAEPGREEC